MGVLLHNNYYKFTTNKTQCKVLIFEFFFNSNQYLHDQITHIIDQVFVFAIFMNSLNILIKYL